MESLKKGLYCLPYNLIIHHLNIQLLLYQLLKISLIPHYFAVLLLKKISDLND